MSSPTSERRGVGIRERLRAHAPRPRRTAAGAGARMLAAGPAGAVTGVSIAVVAGLFAYGGWQRRWIADDGLIVLRTVRNIYAGNGPVFNAGERVEVNTSAAWTYVVAFFGWIIRVRLEYVVLGVALALSVLAVVFLMLGSGRLLRHAGGIGAAGAVGAAGDAGAGVAADRGGRRRAGAAIPTSGDDPGDAGDEDGQAGTRTKRATTVLLPAGVLVYTALPPARDFATSGLEVGLLICWLGLVWWLLMRWATTARPSAAQELALGFVAGLCWLVRPETVLVGGPVLVLLFCAAQPWRRRAALVVVSGAVPVVYQLWRMSYYGLPYPNTAVAKDAGVAKWGQGGEYLADLVAPYVLWVPLALLAVLAAVMGGPTFARFARAALARYRGEPGPAPRTPAYRPPRRHAHPVLRRWRRFQRRLHTPAAAVTLVLAVAVVWLLYELRVGGDFMHGRVLLPVVFLLVAPLALIPVPVPSAAGMRAGMRRVSALGRGSASGEATGSGRRLRGTWAAMARRAPAVFAAALPLAVWIGVVAWSLAIVNVPGVARAGIVTRNGIVDERAFYVAVTGHAHPITAQDYLDFPRMRAMVDTIRASPTGGLLIQNGRLDSWTVIPPTPQVQQRVRAGQQDPQYAVYFINLGMPSMNTPLNVKVYDTVGLDFPLASHTPREAYARIGHDKNLPPDWLVAMLGLADDHDDGLPQWLDEDWVARAQVALTCPGIEDLVDSYTGDLTWSLRWHNLTHAFTHAGYQIDANPQYEIARCALTPPPHKDSTG